MAKPIVPTYCFFKGSYNPEFEKEIAKCKDICFKYNKLSPNDKAKQQEILQGLLGKMGKECTIVASFWCDYGYNISVGDCFYANHNFIVQDGGKIEIGDNVFIGPNCTFTTAEHALDPDMRKDGIEVAKPIKIGSNVWLGAGVIVLAGVTIGDNSVIGAGSVVRKYIPPNVVAVGVPCKVLREITEADKSTYPFYDGESNT